MHLLAGDVVVRELDLAHAALAEALGERVVAEDAVRAPAGLGRRAVRLARAPLAVPVAFALALTVGRGRGRGHGHGRERVGRHGRRAGAGGGGPSARGGREAAGLVGLGARHLCRGRRVRGLGAARRKLSAGPASGSSNESLTGAVGRRASGHGLQHAPWSSWTSAPKRVWWSAQRAASIEHK
jgi:hypothetical protein